MRKCEIYRNEEGLGYVDYNPPFTEFSEFLYDEEFMIKKLEETLELRGDCVSDKALIMKEFKRLIKI